MDTDRGTTMWGTAPKSLRILVVDDNIDGAISLASLVQLWGHEAFLAHDGPGPLAAARQQRPEVVLLDIGLLKIDGYEVAQYLRCHPELGRPLIIAVTGYSLPKDRCRALQSGFDHFMVKPCELSQLQALLSEAAPDSQAVSA